MSVEFEPGQRVCITGVGIDNIVHTHAYRVHRVTKTMIVVQRLDGTKRRFQRRSLRSIPLSAYGGCQVSTHCYR